MPKITITSNLIPWWTYTGTLGRQNGLTQPLKDIKGRTHSGSRWEQVFRRRKQPSTDDVTVERANFKMKSHTIIAKWKKYQCQVNGTKHKFFVYSAFYDDRYISPKITSSRTIKIQYKASRICNDHFSPFLYVNIYFVNITDSSYRTILDHQNSCPPSIPLSPGVSPKEKRETTGSFDCCRHFHQSQRPRHLRVNIRIYAIVDIILISSHMGREHASREKNYLW